MSAIPVQQAPQIRAIRWWLLLIAILIAIMVLVGGAGTLRKLVARSIEANTAHGSDSVENARTEIGWFFALTEIVKYDWKKR